MFLDDELLKMVVDYKGYEPRDVQKLYSEIMGKCQDYYKARINPLKITARELKVVLNKTFNLYDSFVRMALKNSDKKVQILGKLFNEYTFKKEFMKDEELSGIYKSL